MKDVDAERMAASHSLRIRQSMGRKKTYLGFGSRQVSGSEPTDDRSVMLSRDCHGFGRGGPSLFLSRPQRGPRHRSGLLARFGVETMKEASVSRVT